MFIQPYLGCPSPAIPQPHFINKIISTADFHVPSLKWSCHIAGVCWCMLIAGDILGLSTLGKIMGIKNEIFFRKLLRKNCLFLKMSISLFFSVYAVHFYTSSHSVCEVLFYSMCFLCSCTVFLTLLWRCLDLVMQCTQFIFPGWNVVWYIFNVKCMLSHNFACFVNLLCEEYCNSSPNFHVY